MVSDFRDVRCFMDAYRTMPAVIGKHATPDMIGTCLKALMSTVPIFVDTENPEITNTASTIMMSLSRSTMRAYRRSWFLKATCATPPKSIVTVVSVHDQTSRSVSRAVFRSRGL